MSKPQRTLLFSLIFALMLSLPLSAQEVPEVPDEPEIPLFEVPAVDNENQPIVEVPLSLANALHVKVTSLIGQSESDRIVIDNDKIYATSTWARGVVIVVPTEPMTDVGTLDFIAQFTDSEWDIVFWGDNRFAAMSSQLPNEIAIPNNRITQSFSYDRSGAIAWASQPGSGTWWDNPIGNYNDGVYRGVDNNNNWRDGRHCTTYVSRTLHYGGVPNMQDKLAGNGQIVRWMLDNPNLWEFRNSIDELSPGDFILITNDSQAPNDWDYLYPSGASRWGHIMLVTGPGQIGEWNPEYLNASYATKWPGLPYRKYVHIGRNTRYDYNGDSISDIWAVNIADGDTDSVALHIISGADFSQNLISTGTWFDQQLLENDPRFAVADYNRDGVPDIWMFHPRDAGSNSVAVHIVSGADFNTRLKSTGTWFDWQLEENDPRFAVADYNRDGVPDIWMFHPRDGGSNSVAVHIVSGADFSQRLISTGTWFDWQLEENDPRFAVADYNGDGVPDIWMFHPRDAGSNSVAVHIVSGADFNTRLKSTGTWFDWQLAEYDPQFLVSDYNQDDVPDIWMFHPSDAGSGTTAVHIVSGADFSQRLISTGTWLPFTNSQNWYIAGSDRRNGWTSDSSEPTAEPTDTPTDEPTTEPTTEPTDTPTDEPTAEPTDTPTDQPTLEPTAEPTAEPTDDPNPVGGLSWVYPSGTVADTHGHPVYQWTHPAGTNAYELYVGQYTPPITYATKFYDTLTASQYCINNLCSVDLTNLAGTAWLSNGTYHVFINPDPGNLSTWKGPFAFTVSESRPAAPSPAATTGLDTSRPTVNWTLPGSAANSAFFQIYYAPMDDLLSPVFTGWVAREDVCGGWDGTTCSYTANQNLTSGREYGFYIQSWGPGGMSTGGNLGGAADGWTEITFTTNG